MAGSAIVLRLAPDDELTIRDELAGEVDGEDDDVLEDLETLTTGGERTEIDRSLERLWLIEAHRRPHADAQQLRARCTAVAERATLLAS